MPAMASRALEGLACGDQPLDETRLEWGLMPARTPIPEGEALFPRIDLEAWMKEATSNVSDQTTSEARPDAAAAEQKEETPRVSIDEFFKTELRVAQVLDAEKVPKSKKLIRMTVDTGADKRTIVAGIALKYEPEELVGRKVVIVANLQPAKLMGIESNGMVLAASIDGEPSLIAVDPSVPVGTQVR